MWRCSWWPVLLLLTLSAALPDRDIGRQLVLDSNNPIITLEGSVAEDFDNVHTVLVDVEPHQTFSVYTEVLHEGADDPPRMDVTVKQESSIKYWQIPSNSFKSALHAEKVLCPPLAPDSAQRIIIASSEGQTVNYTMRLKIVPYLLSVNDTSMEVTISPTSPKVFKVQLPPGQKEAVASVEATGNGVCGLLAVKPSRESCPFYSLADKETTVRYGDGTQYQTFLEKAVIILDTHTFTEEELQEGLNIFLLAKSDDKICYKNQVSINQTDREINLSLTIRTRSTSREISTLVIAGIYLSCCGIAFIISAICFRYDIELDGKMRKYKKIMQRRIMYNQNSSLKVKSSVKFSNRTGPEKSGSEAFISLGTVDTEDSNDHNDRVSVQLNDIQPTSESTDAVDGRKASISRIGSSEDKQYWKCCWQQSRDISEVDGGTASRMDEGIPRTTRHPFFNNIVRSRNNTESEKDSIVEKVVIIRKDVVDSRRKANNSDNLTLADMCVYFYDANIFHDTLYLKSESFIWLTVLMGIFYALPVFQLTFYHQDIAFNMGNQDICYFNFECLHPWGNIIDYGHFFSNLGYVVSGLLFLVIVRVRNYKYNKVMKLSREFDRNKPTHPNNCGIPEQFGIFYALGIALIMEGILSGCYHLCPTKRNFQFDTTFMYAIAVLVFLKVYQFRHPDVSQTAHIVFMVIALALVFEVVGYYTDHWVFWVFFTFIYIMLLLVIVFQIFHHGDFSWLNNIKWKSPARMSFRCSRQTLWRATPTLTVIFMNIGLAVFFLVEQKQGVSLYLLGILMLNMFLYVMNYVANKLYYRFRSRDWRPSEGIRKTTLIYLFIGTALMVAAIYFFKSELKRSSVSPAESRNINGPCAVGIYDNHDLWHFCSSGSAFFAFLFILTIEDCNIGVPRNEIPVF